MRKSTNLFSTRCYYDSVSNDYRFVKKKRGVLGVVCVVCCMLYVVCCMLYVVSMLCVVVCTHKCFIESVSFSFLSFPFFFFFNTCIIILFLLPHSRSISCRSHVISCWFNCLSLGI